MKTHRTRKRRAFPLQIVLVVPFVLQIFGAVSLVGYLSFKNGQRAVNDLAEQLMGRTSDVVSEHLTAYLAIPQAVQPRIFDPFFTTKPPGKGTGMGMSISYQIITQKHGGKLECFSIPGEGTEFIIRVPLRQQVNQAV